MSMMENEHVIADAIKRIASSAEAMAIQAGIGGMETAGQIVSFLANHPEWVGAFFKNGSVFDLPEDWHQRGCLTWHAKNGKVVHPDYVRRARVIKAL
jgi:hypothetical protein